jgi:hypothetical protein
MAVALNMSVLLKRDMAVAMAIGSLHDARNIRQTWEGFWRRARAGDQAYSRDRRNRFSINALTDLIGDETWSCFLVGCFISSPWHLRFLLTQALLQQVSAIGTCGRPDGDRHLSHHG